MSAVSESMNRRMTLGLLASRYGFDLDPAFATEVIGHVHCRRHRFGAAGSVVHAVHAGG